MVLRRKWFDTRKATFDKTTNVLQICDWGAYYNFHTKPVGESKQDTTNTEEISTLCIKIQNFFDKYQRKAKECEGY